MRLVVFGWGNDARGDDALGPALLDRLAAAWPDLPIVEDFQLQIEHALDLDGADMALFLDAGKGTPAPSHSATCGEARFEPHDARALARGGARRLCAVLGAPPPSFVLCVRGESFELGESLSATAPSASRRRGNSSRG